MIRGSQVGETPPRFSSPPKVFELSDVCHTLSQGTDGTHMKDMWITEERSCIIMQEITHIEI